MARISTEELKFLATRALQTLDMRLQDIEITVDHFLENEMSGKSSHGMVRIVEMLGQLPKTPFSKQDPIIEKDQGNVVLMNAGRQMGTVAGWYLLQEALKRSEKHNLCFLGIRNYVSNSGSMAYYLRRLTAAGLIGFISCNSVALVAPPAGKKRLIGTNPVGFGMPGENGDDFILDMATSAIAYGKTMVLKDSGKPVPEDTLIDENGEASTDPESIENGAILPLADYRGFGLGLMIELLAGPLIGAKAIKDTLYEDDGFFMLVMNPKRIADDTFYAEISESLKTLHQSPPRPGHDKVSLPGDRSKDMLKKTKTNGEINIVDQTLQNLKDIVDG